MNRIRKLANEDVDQLCNIWAHSFHQEGVTRKSIEHRKDFANSIINRLEEYNLYGMFREERLMGGIVLTDYKMQLYSTKILVGGLRAVAVDLLYRKEKTAKELVTFACKHYYDRGACMVALYPFRADFYKNMGFGFGTTLREYKIQTSQIPNYGVKEHLCYLKEEDKNALIDCYNRYMDCNHGMFEKTSLDKFRIFLDDRRVVGYKKDGKILGYIDFSFKYGSDHKSYLTIHEFIYENVNVFREICTFLNTQADQFERIVFETQDESFHFIFNNPANGSKDSYNCEYAEYSVSSIGMMYRIINVRKYFEILKDYNFNNQNLILRINLADNMLIENQESITIRFRDGYASIETDDTYDVEIHIGISEFSSLATGAVSFKSLMKKGLVQLSDVNYMDTVNKVFFSEQKPVCTSHF